MQEPRCWTGAMPCDRYRASSHFLSKAVFFTSILPQARTDKALSSQSFSRHSSKHMILRFPADIIADSTIQASVKSNADGSETWEVEGGNVNLSLIPPICLQQYICNDCNKVSKHRSPIVPYSQHPDFFMLFPSPAVLSSLDPLVEYGHYSCLPVVSPE